MAEAPEPRSSSTSSRASGGGLASSVGSQTIRGALLVLGAVAIGTLMLRVVDDGTVSSTTKTTVANKAADKPNKSTTTTTAPASAPADIKLLVLNSGAPAGGAGALSDALKTAGYTNQDPASNTTTKYTGNYVFCKQGMKADLAALKTAIKAAQPEREVVDAIGLPAAEAASSQGYACLVFAGA